MSEEIGLAYYLAVSFELYFFYILSKSDVIQSLDVNYIRWFHLLALIFIAEPNAHAITNFYQNITVLLLIVNLYFIVSFIIIWANFPFKAKSRIILIILHCFSYLYLSSRW